MRKINRYLAAFLGLGFYIMSSGCALLATTSELRADRDQLKSIRNVGVLQFTGEVYSYQASVQFLDGLERLGLFDNIANLESVERALQKYGLNASQYSNPETRQMLRDMLDLDALFVGSLAAYNNLAAGNAHLIVELIDLKSGETLWACHAQDDRWVSWSADISSTSSRAVRNALLKVKMDMKL